MNEWRPIAEAPKNRELRVRDTRGAEGKCVYENGTWRTSRNKFRVNAVSFLKTWTDDDDK